MLQKKPSYILTYNGSLILTKDLEVGEYDLWLELTKETRSGITDIISNKWDTLLNLQKSTPTVDDNLSSEASPSDTIIQSVDINTKSTSYVGAAGASAKGQPKVNSNFRHFVADPVFDVVNIFIPSKVLEKVNLEADFVDVVTIGIPSLTGDVFTKEIIHIEYEWMPLRCDIFKIFGHVYDHCLKKVKNKKGKFKYNNGGQFAGPSVKQTIRYEPKVTTSAPKKRTTNVGNASTSSSMLKTTGTSSKKDNITTSNSFSALNDDEEDEDEAVENMYDESANLFPNTKNQWKFIFYGCCVKEENKANDHQENLLYARTDFSNRNNDSNEGRGHGSESRGRG
nr:hypothetical protein [Tanacetum cinerariifolium]